MCYLEIRCLIFIYFWNFLVAFLLCISSLIPLSSESSHCMIYILLNLLRCVLWPRMPSLLVHVPCELEAVLTVLFLDEVVLNVHCIQMIDGTVELHYILTDFLSAGSVVYDRGVLKSSTMIADSLSPCRYIRFCLT